MIVFISINVVSASDNITDSQITSEIVLNTSDVDLFGDNMQYNATVTSTNGTPLSNQTIIFCVNGMNYTKITNFEGLAFLDINLADGVYPILTTFKDLTNENTIYVSHNEGTLIKDNLSGLEIQKIIDEANSGDTIIFAGNNYDDVSINVNKSLNIMSIVKSVFKGNSNSPVITISSNNVNISNIIISGGLAGIYLDSVENVGIFSNDINGNYNGIYLKNSNNINISQNNLLNNYNGIYFDDNVLNTLINSNYISKSQNNAINFAKSGSHTTVSGNTLENNENGIFVDMVGDEDFNIIDNTIQRNKDNGIYFGQNYRKTNETGILNIGNNSIVYNSGFNILARDSIYMKINLKANWIASDNPRFNGVCEKIKFQKYHMNVNQIDGNTLSVSVDGIKTDSLLRYSTNGGKNWQYATLVDGKATINVANDDGNLVFDYYEDNYNDNYQYQMKDYVPPAPVSPVSPVNPSNSGESTGNRSNNNQAERIDGNGTSTNSNSGSSQGQNSINVDNSNNMVEQASSQTTESASSQDASQMESAASDSQSVSKQISDPSESIAKVLNVDEEVVRIAGMGFIVLLIILVIAGYYRDDVKYMLNKRNEQ